jgi:hypothetical protein
MEVSVETRIAFETYSIQGAVFDFPASLWMITELQQAFSHGIFRSGNRNRDWDIERSASVWRTSVWIRDHHTLRHGEIAIGNSTYNSRQS